MKAVERFDPQFGVPFAGFAVPTITGELRRHFRDATWSLKVPRRAKDLHVRIPVAINRLSAQTGRTPTPAEIAEELGVSIDDLLDALDAGAAYRTTSTDTTEGALAAGHASVRNPVVNEGLPPDERVLLTQLLESLDERERTIVYLRFFEDLSQSEIAAQVGMSQVHVSRLLRRALRDLRELAGVDRRRPDRAPTPEGRGSRRDRHQLARPSRQALATAPARSLTPSLR